MVLVARARTLASSEADSIEPQALSLVRDIGRLTNKVPPNDPLLQWFTADTAGSIRNLECRIRTRLISKGSWEGAAQFEKISCFAATFYVALFSVCRSLTRPFCSSNPTWLKAPKGSERRLSIPIGEVMAAFIRQAKSIAESLQYWAPRQNHKIHTRISVGNTTHLNEGRFADLIFTSPPYCTRIDYTAATRVELAVISPLMEMTRDSLSREMIGSIKVPTNPIVPQKDWGEACLRFLDRLASHKSKASRGYYFKTHVDYFDKMSKSITNLSNCLKDNGVAILVVQDSYYKEIHNDLPLVLTEMAERVGLSLFRREDFLQRNSLSRINPKSRLYREVAGASESVICFRKIKNRERL